MHVKRIAEYLLRWNMSNIGAFKILNTEKKTHPRTHDVDYCIMYSLWTRKRRRKKRKEKKTNKSLLVKCTNNAASEWVNYNEECSAAEWMQQQQTVKQTLSDIRAHGSHNRTTTTKEIPAKEKRKLQINTQTHTHTDTSNEGTNGEWTGTSKVNENNEQQNECV